MFQFEEIGYVESCYKERFGTPRQAILVPSSWGIIHLRPELNLQDGLEGLEGFSHLWVIFVFHQNTNKNIKMKVHPPRMQGEKTGVFATRSPHRPNPIGLSAVKIEKIEGLKIFISGVDLVDGTPVLDIKPYIAEADSLSETRSGWLPSPAAHRLEVEFAPEALLDLQRLRPIPQHEPERFLQLMQLIRGTLQLDPRPTFYKGTNEQPNPYTNVYGFCLENLNIVYRMEGQTALVIKLEETGK
jgi:tRNA-Thr(GGU) m(6)t(6)A37 methyltransferase TsaA